MMNYNTGKPNARYWVLKLIKDNSHPGDTLVATTAGSGASNKKRTSGPKGHMILLALCTG